MVIAPDSSSNDYEEHKILKEKGIDVLVIDHHEADTISENQTNENIHGFCPECGYGIPHHLDEGELKKLNQRKI